MQLNHSLHRLCLLPKGTFSTFLEEMTISWVNILSSSGDVLNYSRSCIIKIYQSAILNSQTYTEHWGGHICLLIHKGLGMGSRGSIQRSEATPCGEGVMGLKSRASARNTSKSGHGVEVNPWSLLIIRAFTPPNQSLTLMALSNLFIY